MKFEGWNAQELSNEWIRVILVPELGGRVMQVIFAGHAYLIVNPKYKGKTIPPSAPEAKGNWINYGGDKIWPLPEGTQDEQHWAGPVSDNLDDGAYAFKILSQDKECKVRLDGPAEERTGLQYSREIGIGGDSPEISFRAVMKNASGHSIRWSVQSVTQYDATDASNKDTFNPDFWAFTPVNPRSVYPGGFHVRSGLADDPSFLVKDGLFTLHWLFLQNEVWIDSPGEWLAVVDGQSQFAMVEKFRHQDGAEYPGDATVIFYKNGASIDVDEHGIPHVHPENPKDELLYMEAEVNSPMVRLEPGETYTMDTQWSPTRAGRGLQAVTPAGIIGVPFTISKAEKGIVLSGELGVFVSGKLMAWIYGRRGDLAAQVELQSVSPAELVRLHHEMPAPEKAARISLHVVDRMGNDRGSLGEAFLDATGRRF